MSTLPDHTNYQLVESEMITKSLDTPLYNITKGIPWLAQKWPEIQLYLLTGNHNLMGRAPLEAPSSGEETLEPESSDTKQSQEWEQEEDYEYTLSEEEDLEVARVEAEKQKYIFQQPPTGPPPALKKSLDKGKQPQFQDYTQRSEDKNQTPSKRRARNKLKRKMHLKTHTVLVRVGQKEARRLEELRSLQMKIQMMILVQEDQMLEGMQIDPAQKMNQIGRQQLRNLTEVLEKSLLQWLNGKRLQARSKEVPRQRLTNPTSEQRSEIQKTVMVKQKNGETQVPLIYMNN